MVATYRKAEELEALREQAGLNGSLLEGDDVDVTDEAEVSALVGTIVVKHGRLDAMVNTIGSSAGGMKLWEMESKVFDQMLALNLRSGYALSRAAVRVMLQQGNGAIVNVAAKAAFDHGAGAAAYAASKAAAVAMMDCLAEDLKGSGVRANSVLPSIIDTEANRKAMPHADFAKWPKPEEIARVIVFPLRGRREGDSWGSGACVWEWVREVANGAVRRNNYQSKTFRDPSTPWRRAPKDGTQEKNWPPFRSG